MKLIYFLTIYCFLLLNSTLFYAQADSLSLVKRIQKIEAREELEEQEFESRLDKLSIANEKLMLEKKQAMENNFYKILGIGSLLGIVGLLIGWFTYVKEKIRREVDDQIATVLKEKKATIKGVIKEYEEERDLLLTKKIHIYGNNNSTNIAIETLLHDLGADKEYLHKGEIINTKVDLVFINNKFGELLSRKPGRDATTEQNQNYQNQFQALESMMSNQAKNVCFFYYSEAGINLNTWELKDKKLKDRVNYCTNPAQVYANLLSTLKRQDSIR